jgi:lipoprotein-anchoring transpeptidase ErfK/SrfK
MATPIQTIAPPIAGAVVVRRWPRRLLVGTLAVLAFTLAASAALAALGGAYRVAAFPQGTWQSPESAPDPKKVEQRATRAIKAAQPHGTWVVVDTYKNRLRVYRDGELLRDAVCSTGKGSVLRDPRNGRQWVFDTPTGERTVQRKVKDPIWAKPDWAFIEEGYAPPPSSSPDRFDDFSLGKYGLYMGDGYIIHGTIFQTLLGQRVTHGCIRLGDKDLEYVYKQVPLGAKVYLY